MTSVAGWCVGSSVTSMACISMPASCWSRAMVNLGIIMRPSLSIFVM